MNIDQQLHSLSEQDLMDIIKDSEPEERDRYVQLLLQRYQHDPTLPFSFENVDFERIPFPLLVDLNKNTTDLTVMYHLRRRLYESQRQEITDQLEEEVLVLAMQTHSPCAASILYQRYQNDIEQAPDEYLVLLVQKGQTELKERLTERLYPFVQRVVSNMKAKGMLHSRSRDIDDFVQEACIGLLNAYDDYKIDRKTKFSEFARNVIFKHILTELKKEKTKRGKASNNSLSYYKQVGDESGDATFLDLIHSNELTPEEMLVTNHLIESGLPIFSDKERNAFSLQYFGFSYKEIAHILNTNIKGVDNAIQRVHTKGERYYTAVIEDEEYAMKPSRKK